jgi:hypothetical protein
MAFQMYFIRPKAGVPETANEQIADFVAGHGGYILMTTSRGSLIVGLDDEYYEALRVHHLVQHAGPVTLNPEGKAAKELQRIFATNMARQMLARKSSS